MISCPAANEIRWVNPSIATVSPSRTRAAIASRIVATFEVVTGDGVAATARSAGDLAIVQRARDGGLGGERGATPGHFVHGIREQPQSSRHLGLGHGESRRHADAGLAAL